MTVAEIEDHAARLRGRLDEEKRKVRDGDYVGSRRANLALIAALEGRLGELDVLVQQVKAQTLAAAVPALVA
jgi:hypothetical protein